MGESEVEKRIRKMKEEWALQAEEQRMKELAKNPSNDRKIEKSEKFPLFHRIKTLFNNLIK